MEASKSGIVMLKVEKLMHHPENPRKEIGDISELTESVKKNGIMQNLTVTPVSIRDDYYYSESADELDDVDMSEGFYVIIGNRRLEAARAAGLSHVPCVIVTQIGIKEQLGIMLEENMQRSDLTVIEQAQGFQMMLDLGETVDSIAEKTGFSKSTIYHRVNMAKLDQKELERKQGGEFQLSIKDIIELEKVKDIDKRNDLLKRAIDSKDLRYRVGLAVTEEKRQAYKDKLLELMDDMEAVKDTNAQSWRDGYELMKSLSLDNEDEDPETAIENMLAGEMLMPDDEIVWNEGYHSISIYKVIPKDDSDDADDEAESEWDVRQREAREAINNLNRITDVIKDNIGVCIRNIIASENTNVKEADGIEMLWKLLVSTEAVFEPEDIAGEMEKIGIIKPNPENEEEDFTEKAMAIYRAIRIDYQMLIIVGQQFDYLRTYTYSRTYDKRNAERFSKLRDILREYTGFDWADEDQIDLIVGTSSYYKKDGE